MSARRSYIVCDSYGSGYQGVAGIGVAFRSGRIICGDIVEAPDLLAGELLAILRAVGICSKAHPAAVVYTDHELAAGMVNEPAWASHYPLVGVIQKLLAESPGITVVCAPTGVTRAARIVAKQVFKAWKCSFNNGVTWGPGATRTVAA